MSKPTRKKPQTSAAALAERIKAEAMPPLEPIVTPPTGQFVEAVYGEIQAMEQARRDAGRVPDHILYRELERQLSAALNALYKDGRISVGLTLNDKYIRTTNEQS